MGYKYITEVTDGSTGNPYEVVICKVENGFVIKRMNITTNNNIPYYSEEVTIVEEGHCTEEENNLIKKTNRYDPNVNAKIVLRNIFNYLMDIFDITNGKYDPIILKLKLKENSDEN